VYAASAAFDPSLEGVVLFGGGSGGVDQNTTWLWDQVGATWTQLSIAHSPPAREGAGMSYDAALHRVILFGGQDNNGYFNDTWELVPAPTPTPTPTPTPSPTATLTPTPTPSVTPAPRATPRPRPTPHPRPTPLMIPHLSDSSPTSGRRLDGIIPVNSIHSLSRFVD